MIEKTILDYLNGVLSVPAYMERPENPPESYVIIEKTGSGRENRLNSATLAIKSHAPTLYGAAELNEAVKAAMDNAVSLSSVTRCRLNSDYNYTEDATRQYRYQAVFDLWHY